MGPASACRVLVLLRVCAISLGIDSIDDGVHADEAWITTEVLALVWNNVLYGDVYDGLLDTVSAAATAPSE